MRYCLWKPGLNGLPTRSTGLLRRRRNAALPRALWILALATAVSAATLPSGTTIRGKLVIHENAPATIETADRHIVTLSADNTISQVLGDERLNGFEVQAKGHFIAPDKFQIDPSHTIPFLVHQDGHLKMVSYWCDVCSIRAYTPGPCRCCQKETVLDLRDPDHQ